MRAVKLARGQTCPTLRSLSLVPIVLPGFDEAEAGHAVHPGEDVAVFWSVVDGVGLIPLGGDEFRGRFQGRPVVRTLHIALHLTPLEGVVVGGVHPDKVPHGLVDLDLGVVEVAPDLHREHVGEHLQCFGEGLFLNDTTDKAGGRPA